MRLPALPLLAALLAPAAQAESIDAQFDALYRRASADTSGTAMPLVFIQLTQEAGQSDDSNFHSLGQMVNYLADDFSLYLRLHTEIMPIACASSGLDIQDYVRDFRSANEADSARVQRAYAVLGTDYDAIWQALRAPAKERGDWLLGQSATTLQIPAADVCRMLHAQPALAAQRLKYSAVRPSRSEILSYLSP